MPRRAGKQRGRGVASTIMSGLKWARDNQIASRLLGAIPHPAAQAVGQLAGMAGLGRKRRTRKKRVMIPRGHAQRGRGIFSDLGGGVGSVFKGIGGGLFGNGRGRRRNARKSSLLM